MDDLVEIYENSEKYGEKMHNNAQAYLQKLHVILWGEPANFTENKSDGMSPRPKTKRTKRLSSCPEDEYEARKSSEKNHSKKSDKQLELVVAATPKAKDTSSDLRKSEELMPPPAILTETTSDLTFVRPKRLAKLKSEKNLKEPKLNSKLRRPSECNEVKKEHEQRQSQMHNQIESITRSKSSNASTKSNESVVVVAAQTLSIVDINSDDESTSCMTRSVRVMVKREKSSLIKGDEKSVPPAAAAPPEDTEATVMAALTVPLPKEIVKVERISDDSTVASLTSITSNPKTRRKKNVIVLPIKVERFSEVGLGSPIASRTRNGSMGRANEEDTEIVPPTEKPIGQRTGSIYEDAVDILPSGAKAQATCEEIAIVNINETVTLAANNTPADGVPADATFCANAARMTFQIPAEQGTFILNEQNPNATVTKSCEAGNDATFNVALPKDDGQTSFVSARQSIETAQPPNDTLITEDESFEQPAKVVGKLPPPKVPISTKPGVSAKAYKMPTRTNELFNPLIQSPVKMKVKAFENVVNAVNTDQHGKKLLSKGAKENASLTGSSTTPTIGKLPPPILGRFLTPTQGSNITPNCMVQQKKQASSASKAMVFPKGTTVAAATTTSAKALLRENSADDFRKGLQQMAEERKKQREQKHQLAAMQREAKERLRAERMAKLAKEREEKRLKKQQEAEQKKRELEEIHRKLRQNEEAAAEAARQKADKALQSKQAGTSGGAKSRMMPPPPKVQSKYTFEMLHEDDSTDDEGKVTYKRPPPPSWSRNHVRGPAILMQQHWPTDIIDSFFSVQPMTPDLKVIFPNIDARLLKRNSSVLWSTPPRYSELPEY